MKRILFIAILTIGVNSLFAQEVFVKSGEAIQGYDPVAYFNKNEPVKGRKEFVFLWKGASWYFSNAQNLQVFKANPEKYAPKFGGYCAYGTAEGHKAPTSPDAWSIVDGKLYLNYNKDVRELWKKDRTAFIKKANENWPKVKMEKD